MPSEANSGPKPIIILGTGGNCVDILDTIAEINAASREPRYECLGFLDDDREKWGADCFGVKILGPLEAAARFPEAYFVNGIGSERNFWRKAAIIAKTKLPLERFISLIHPTASLSRLSSIGFGTVILQHATVASSVRLGNHIMVLPNAVISHDDVVGDYTCITGGVCISGRVRIGEHCYLGTNSAVISDVSIGDYCLIGMGSVVLRDVPANSVVVGNPARFLRKTHDE